MPLVKIAGITKAAFHLVTPVALKVFYQIAIISLLHLVVALLVRAKENLHLGAYAVTWTLVAEPLVFRGASPNISRPVAITCTSKLNFNTAMGQMEKRMDNEMELSD